MTIPHRAWRGPAPQSILDFGFWILDWTRTIPVHNPRGASRSGTCAVQRVGAREWPRFAAKLCGAVIGGLLLAGVAGCLSPAQRAVAIWVVSGDQELSADTPPSPENDVYSASAGELRLRAALNETATFQVALRTTAPPAGPFHIQISDLAGPQDTLPARSAVTVYRAQYARVEHFRSWYPDHTGKPSTPTLFPDILVPWEAPRGGGPVLLSEPRNEIIWVDLYVPATVAPGEYRGRLELTSGVAAAPAFACRMRLEVLPVALPQRRSLPVVCRVDPRDLLAAHLRWPRAAAEQTPLLPGVASYLPAVELVGQTVQLFHAHRATPVLWAAFPKFRPAGDRAVEVQWDEYDQLVAGWIDGSAFADRVRPELWPLPASLEYPSAESNGGVNSPRYAGLLAAYLAECRRHFAERGWLDRAFLRLCPPQPLTQASVDQMRRLSGIARQAEIGVPVVAHLPARSLRGLGWHEAPSVELPDVTTWAPPAMWYEPAVMERERKLGRQTWFMPDCPPYSASLAVEAPASDPRTLAWQAYRYGAQAIWIEHAADFGSQAESGPGLVYPAVEYGLRDRPVPSVRLKRLRRGLEDYELLRLLEANGKQLLARQLAEQVVRWAGTDACLDNLVSCKDSGWPTEASVLGLARALVLQELVSEFAPDPAARQQQLAALSQWGLIMNQAGRVVPRVDGVRLAGGSPGLRALVLASVLNGTSRPLQGRWTLPTPPPEWQQVGEAVMSLEPGTRRPARIELSLAGLAYNIDGVYPFDLAFDTAALGSFRVPARLAVAVCPQVEISPVPDGRLDDWRLAANNAGGDFRLCRGRTSGGKQPDRPTLPTQAFFCMDATHIYIAMRCTLPPGEPPLWQADNTIPIDGGIPWGQDVIEVLIDPRPAIDGASSDLYCLQVKPNGLLVARKGCRTEPPVGTSQDWQSGARVAVSVGREAWVVEMAVPLAALGPQARQNRVWGLNVTRLDARRGEYSSWSGARGCCYSPQALGNLIMLWP